jgi:predicted RNA-binding protein with TRAM domain
MALLLLLAACAGGGGPPGTHYADVAAQIPKLTPDQARFFFYRYYEPYEGLDRPYIRLNGAVAAISEPGGVSYRDVAPGTYLVSVDSPGAYPNQNKTVAIKAGETVYVLIQSYRAYNEGFENYSPATFVVAITDPAEGQTRIETMVYYPAP